MGSDVEEQVTAFLGAVAKGVKQDIGGTPAFTSGISPEPPVGHLTGFPHALLRPDGVLRGAEIAGRLRIAMHVLRAGVRGFQGAKAVVDQDPRLQIPHPLHEFRTPEFGGAARPCPIEPEDINLPVPGQELLDLMVQVGEGLWPFLGVFFGPFEIGRKPPVQPRVIEPDLKPGLSKGIQERCYKITFGSLFGAGVIRECGIPQAVPVMMPRGQYGVFETGSFSEFRPLDGIIGSGIPFACLLGVRALVHMFPKQHLLAPTEKRVRAPVEEETNVDPLKSCLFPP